ncbi:MAG: hypothetical protein QG671_1522 [Actinomycetota bacterium]|nr:hypothetical protein [Actinomycetota bacterium]
MHSRSADGDSRLSLWLHVREFAAPPSMIECATVRRNVSDWAGACAATNVYGRELATRIRDDLQHLAPDLLRWHMPRIAPVGLLRPGLTISLARYTPAEPAEGHGDDRAVQAAPPLTKTVWPLIQRAGPANDATTSPMS